MAAEASLTRARRSDAAMRRYSWVTTPSASCGPDALTVRPGFATELLTYKPAAHVLLDRKAPECARRGIELALRRHCVRLRRREVLLPRRQHALVRRDRGRGLFVGVQVRRDLAVDVERRRAGQEGRQVAGDTENAVDVARHPVGRGRAPGALVDDGEERPRWSQRRRRAAQR